jgi:hypothetical protein
VEVSTIFETNEKQSITFVQLPSKLLLFCWPNIRLLSHSQNNFKNYLSRQRKNSSKMTIQGAKYDMRVNPIYQVDWSNQASGKRLSATKRRIRWRFGFSNREAILDGCTGVECRGEEHEVVFVWSLASGKRFVLADDKEVHFSTGGKMTDTRFETAWGMPGGHMVKLIAHAAPPLVHKPGFRQFDLQIDGCSFFDFPKIFQLGTKKSRALVPMSPTGGAYNNYSLSPNAKIRFAERPEVRMYRSEPALESSPKDFAKPRRAESESLDLVSDDATPTATNGTLDLMDDAPAQSSPVTVVQDEFAPAPPKPASFEDKSNQILSAYGPPPPSTPSLPALANESHTFATPPPQQQPYQPAYVSPEQQQQQVYYQQQQQAYYQPEHQHHQQAYYQQPEHQQYYPEQQPQYYRQTQHPYQQQQAPVPVTPESSPTYQQEHQLVEATFPEGPVLTMEKLAVEEIEEREAPPMSPMEKAFQTLVNLEDINETKETPEMRKYYKLKKEKEPYVSKPLPPTKADWTLPMNASLGDIRQHAPPKAAPAKEIMRTHAFDPAAGGHGMMVVYGQAPPQPLQPSYYHGYGVSVQPHMQPPMRTY